MNCSRRWFQVHMLIHGQLDSFFLSRCKSKSSIISFWYVEWGHFSISNDTKFAEVTYPISLIGHLKVKARCDILVPHWSRSCSHSWFYKECIFVINLHFLSTEHAWNVYWIFKINSTSSAYIRVVKAHGVSRLVREHTQLMINFWLLLQW